MVEPRQLEDIAHRLAQAMPPGLHVLREELEQNFRAILQSSLERFDLVGRDQFEAQAAVLLRTREKLQALEKKLEVLEGRLTGADESAAGNDNA